MEPLLAKKGRRTTIRQRIKWLLAKPKLITKMVALDSLKLTLTMFICTIRFVDGDNFKDSMKAEIKEKVLQSGKTETAFLHADRLDREAERAYEAEHARHELERDGGETHDSAAEPHEDTEGSGDRALPSTDALDGPRESNELHTRETQLSDLEIRDTMPTEQLAMIDEHLRLHAAVSSFALVAMNDDQKGPISANIPASLNSGPHAGFSSRPPGPSAVSDTEDEYTSEYSESDDSDCSDDSESPSEQDQDFPAHQRESHPAPSGPSGARPERVHQHQGADAHATPFWHTVYEHYNPGPKGYQFSPAWQCICPNPSLPHPISPRHSPHVAPESGGRDMPPPPSGYHGSYSDPYRSNAGFYGSPYGNVHGSPFVHSHPGQPHGGPYHPPYGNPHAHPYGGAYGVPYAGHGGYGGYGGYGRHDGQYGYPHDYPQHYHGHHGPFMAPPTPPDPARPPTPPKTDPVLEGLKAEIDALRAELDRRQGRD
ncbi:hypothetical protein RB594_000234 [Gaeumannomyces avenae]